MKLQHKKSLQDKAGIQDEAPSNDGVVSHKDAASKDEATFCIIVPDKKTLPHMMELHQTIR